MKNQAPLPETDRTIHAKRLNAGSYRVREGDAMLPYLICRVNDRWGVFGHAQSVSWATSDTIQGALSYVAQRVVFDEQWAAYQQAKQAKRSRSHACPPPMCPSLRVDSPLPGYEIRLLAEPTEDGIPVYAVEFAGRIVGRVGLYGGIFWAVSAAANWYRHVWVNVRYGTHRTPQKAAQQLVRVAIDAVITHQLGPELAERDEEAEKIRAQYA